MAYLVINADKDSYDRNITICMTDVFETASEASDELKNILFSWVSSYRKFDNELYEELDFDDEKYRDKQRSKFYE